METTNQFIYTHWAKLAWKFAKHGAGVALGIEKREGIQETIDKDVKYIEIVYG